MKNWLVLFIPILMMVGCSKDFLVRAPEDSITDANFYQNDQEVMAGTALLYSKVWFDFNNTASFFIGDFRGGDALSNYNDGNWVWFKSTSTDGANSSAWSSMFVVVGQSNTAIQNINKYASSAVTPAIKKEAIAEARFMRALAYRYLVMNWGPVPIITNNSALLMDTSITCNTVPSIWKFITYEMRAAANDLPTTPYAAGRLTKWSAEGMLARFYLSRAAIESNGGVRNQTFLDSAKYYAKDVIENSGASLLPNYYSLFKYPYNNNKESLFELQWTYSSTQYGVSNNMPSFLMFSNSIANGDGWGGDLGATYWMLSKYSGFVESASGDSIVGKTTDQRLYTTFMLPGASYPEIMNTVTLSDGTSAEQGLVFPNTTGVRGQTVTNASIKKYVVGKSPYVTSSSQHYPNHTYMMRLSEMYLTYADAALGNNSTTSDPTALAYFNIVHARGFYPNPVDLTYTSLAFDDIFNERVIEFAMEGMCWYDFVNLHYWNPTKALNILNSQYRGGFAIFPDKYPNTNNNANFSIIKTTWWTPANGDNQYITASDGNFLLPIPASELAGAPNLTKTPVDYYGGK